METTKAEQEILLAAEHVFYRKGKEGASMQEIADEANITRTSLNYYYRSKDKLFEAVFRQTMSHFVPRVVRVMEEQDSLSTYLPKLVEVIVDTMIEKPQIPVFVLQELTSNPGRVPQMIQELGLHSYDALEKLKKDPFFQKLPVDPRQFIINILSMCIFPFAAKPVLLNIMFEADEEAYIDAMKARKLIIPMMINQMINSLQS